MHSSTSAVPRGNRELHLLGSEGILFCHLTSRLFHLNTAATYLWCCMEDGLDPQAAAAALSKQFGIPLTDAARDIEASLADWRSNGLLPNPSLERREGNDQESGKPGATDPSANTGLAFVAQHGKLKTGPELAAGDTRPTEVLRSPCMPISAVGDSTRLYRAGPVSLRVRFPSPDSEALVHPVFAHLEEDAALAADTPSSSVEIARAGDGFTVYRNGERTDGPLCHSALAPVVVREALLSAFELSNCLVAIHAAAVSNDAGGLLLPGAPGSGKSTLAAAMMSEGLNCLTDELVLLTPKPHRIQPVPVSLSIKTGSWALLRKAFPSLETLPIHRQADGTQVRYLPPSRGRPTDPREFKLRAIVFPRYGSQDRTGLRAMGPAEALYRLAEAGYAVPGSLDGAIVSQLIAWLNRIPCFGLGVRDLTTATSQLKGLLT